ncbi:MAG TPA: hypothetical protein VFO59_06520, partial [Dehalococcoidia bacterium]|nr:hypothetical protein [Dehalococcoidia bacterium]
NNIPNRSDLRQLLNPYVTLPDHPGARACGIWRLDQLGSAGHRAILQQTQVSAPAGFSLAIFCSW